MEWWAFVWIGIIGWVWIDAIGDIVGTFCEYKYPKKEE